MMPAGKYYVGDLCYVMHPQWDEFCKLTISGHDCLEGEFNLANGVRFASFGTKYGDGGYYDQNGREYAVDAGLIGCILISDITDPELASAIDKDSPLGHVIEFDKPFETSGGRSTDRSWDGVIHIGHVAIETDPEEDEEEYEEEEEEIDE